MKVSGKSTAGEQAPGIRAKRCKPLKFKLNFDLWPSRSAQRLEIAGLLT
ncbi:hypothetical protein OCAR_4590 [Afipia carboxidovorans OM5]|nr:hypothetical protein OCAR_4590 [Afipia carboxidovorans OM5]